MPQIWKKLGELLVEAGALAPDQVTLILEQMKTSGRNFGDTGLELGCFDERDLAQALARQYNLEFVDLNVETPDLALQEQFPADLSRKLGVIPLARDGDLWVLAIANPTNLDALAQVEAALAAPITLRVAAAREIQRWLEQGQPVSRQALQEASEDLRPHILTADEGGEELLSPEKADAETSPVIKLIDTTLVDALKKRASDIHIESGPIGVVIKYRVDGVLFRATEPLDRRFQGPIISRIKVMSDLDISERRIPQDGRFKARIAGRSIDFRVSILPSSFGEDAVIRILDKGNIDADLRGLTLTALGFNQRELKRFRRLIHEPYGMVLVTGPTGSGKTTTLYAALAEIYTEQEKIITIEDPVEYQVRGIVQVPVNEKKGLTFARGLRSVLRHDPDKIMVGEIRDPETAQIAVQSALTGHLVFTTVHANNVFDVIGRFLHMGLEPYQFVSCLNGVLAQRLVRKICDGCREPVRYEREFLLASGLQPERFKDVVFFQGRGCEHCHGQGYVGRSAIIELLVLNDALRELIIARAPVATLRQEARRNGTVFLREAALEKVVQGVTSLTEINRVTFVDQEPKT